MSESIVANFGSGKIAYLGLMMAGGDGREDEEDEAIFSSFFWFRRRTNEQVECYGYEDE